MSQADSQIGSGQSGTAYRTADNAGKKAILNHHKGSSAPSYKEAGMIWLDDTGTPWLLKSYDGTDWITTGAVNASLNEFTAYHGSAALRLLNHAADTGSANAYAVAPSPVITAYATGMIVTLKPANANTTASTLTVNGLTAKNIKTLDGSDPAAGQLATTGVYFLMYDGTSFIVTNPTIVAVSNTVSVTVKDANFTIQDDGDTTKQVKFQASGITTATTRTLTVPNASGTLALTSDIPSAGVIADRAYAEYTSAAGLTTVIPLDDTIPQVTEGDEILSASITPKSATNRIRATVHMFVQTSSGTINGAAALFVNGGSNAVNAVAGCTGNTGRPWVLSLQHEYVPGTTSAQTLSVRAGPGSSGALYVNVNSGSGRVFGGVARATLVLEEITAS